MKKEEYIILYNERHEEYDLFADLKDRDDVHLIVTQFKDIKFKAIKYVRKIHLSKNIADHICLPFKKKWYKKVTIEIKDDTDYYFLVFDMALETVPISYIKQITERPNVKSALILLNSVDGAIIRRVKKDIAAVTWDAIYTFDDEDAKKYGYKSLGFSYYSRHSEESLSRESAVKKSDIYYIGTLVTNRKKQILSVYEHLRKGNLNIEFHLMKCGKERYEKFPYQDEIDYFTTDRGLIPYKQVLTSILQTNTILEIVQATQSGPTLRYYEAVCYNKKLLTNNPYIVNFPFYDDRYMKVFSKMDEMDLEWVREDIQVNYHYNNEFSPVHLLRKISDDMSFYA